MARTYASPLRTAQAADTRRRILDAAADCFGELGYAGTSLAAIAAAGGVSLETVKANGPKSALLLGAFDQAFTGSEGAGAIHERDEGAELAAVGAEQLVAAFVSFIAGANERIHRLWPALLAAATGDAVVRSAYEAMQARRRSDFRAAIALFRERGLLRGEADDDQLAAALSFLISPESHTQLVVESGWSPAAYRDFLARAIERLILQP